MKSNNFILSLLAIFTMTLCQAQNPNDIVNIPDPLLKDYLVNHYYTTQSQGVQTTHYLDVNQDGEIQYGEAETYTSWPTQKGFNLTALGISDLTGIEAFKSIEYLSLNDNNLTEIDVSGCVSLTEIIISSNPVLTFELHSPALKKIILSNNPVLTSVNLSGCTTLDNVNISNNDNLESINLLGINVITELRINYNPVLANIEKSLSYELTLYQSYSNGLTSIDVSDCPSLELFYCSGNPNLTSLNLANGNMSSFDQIIATNNPNLFCVEVDNAVVADYLWDGYPFEFDSWASFSEDCIPPGPCYVTIPDANLKAHLLANANINTNGNDEIECDEAEAYFGEINLDNLEINDFTGIEAFINIASFSSYNNTVDPFFSGTLSLDLSGFTNMTSLSITNHPKLAIVKANDCPALTSVDISTYLQTGVEVELKNCTALTDLNLQNKKINSLNLEGCSQLITLNCSQNLLTSLNIGSNLALTSLNCADNQLSNINVSNNISLTDINVSKNELLSLLISLNTNLETLNCSYNLIDYLDVGNNLLLTTLDCSHNELDDIQVNNNQNLTSLNCGYNNLSNLPVNNNVALVSLICEYNQLSEININNLINLKTLICTDNQLPVLVVNSNTALENLHCAKNNLTNLNLSQNENLKQLDCSENLFTEIDLSANQDLIILMVNQNQLSTLNLENKFDLVILDCSHNLINSLDLSESYTLSVNCSNNNLQTLNLANTHNEEIFTITADNNDLTCIQVDDADFSTTNWIDNPNFTFDSGISFSEDCTLSVSTMGKVDFAIYPNPTNESIYFTEKSNVQVLDLNGRILLHRNNISSINLEDKAPGIYFVNFLDNYGQTIQTKKIIKK